MPKKHNKTPKRTHKAKSTSKMNIMKGVGKYSMGTSRLKGRGGYAEDIGSGIGSWLGKKAGSLFSSITGLGEYKVNKNSLIAHAPMNPPVVSNTNGGTRVQHREYITDISGSIAWNIASYSINPGLANTFPWLASVANAFEEYKMHGIIFEFKSTSADALNSTNTALGTVIMATEYNPLHGVFTGKRDMENYVYSTSNAPSISAMHPIECARDASVLDELFVRNVPLTGADLRFSDLGNFQIATIGMQAAATIGELWVTYDIELIKPKLPDALTSIGSAHYAFSTGTPALGSNGAPTVASLYGTTALQKYAIQGTGATPVTINSNVMTFTALGQYLVVHTYIGGAAACSAPGATLGAGISNVGILHSGTPQVYLSYPQAGLAGDLNLCTLLSFNVISLTAATVTFAGGVIPTSVTDSDIFVIPLPNGFSLYNPTETEIMRETIKQLTDRIENFLVPHNTPRVDSNSILIVDEDDDSSLSESTIDLVQMLQTRLNKR